LSTMNLAPILGSLLVRSILASRGRGIPQKRDQGWRSSWLVRHVRRDLIFAMYTEQYWSDVQIIPT
jgi:hypothetical protein